MDRPLSHYAIIIQGKILLTGRMADRVDFVYGMGVPDVGSGPLGVYKLG